MGFGYLGSLVLSTFGIEKGKNYQNIPLFHLNFNMSSESENNGLLAGTTRTNDNIRKYEEWSSENFDKKEVGIDSVYVGYDVVKHSEILIIPDKGIPFEEAFEETDEAGVYKARGSGKLFEITVDAQGHRHITLKTD